MNTPSHHTQPSIATLLLHHNQFNCGKGPALTQQEQLRLNAWREMSQRNEQVFKKVTDPHYFQNRRTFYLDAELKRIRYYELIQEYFYKDTPADKIRSDEKMIGLMADGMVALLDYTGQEQLQTWAASSERNKAIYEEYQRAIKQMERAKNPPVASRRASWKRFQKHMYLDLLRKKTFNFLKRTPLKRKTVV